MQKKSGLYSRSYNFSSYGGRIRLQKLQMIVIVNNIDLRKFSANSHKNAVSAECRNKYVIYYSYLYNLRYMHKYLALYCVN